MSHPFVTNITAPDPATIEVRENGRIYFDGSYIGSYRHNKVTSAPYGLQQVPAENIAAVLNLVSDAIHAKAMGPQAFADFQNKLYGTNVSLQADMCSKNISVEEKKALEQHIEVLLDENLMLKKSAEFHHQAFRLYANDVTSELSSIKQHSLCSFSLFGYTFSITKPKAA